MVGLELDQKDGLYYGGLEGVIKSIDIKKQGEQLKLFSLDESIVSMNLSFDGNFILFSTNTGIVRAISSRKPLQTKPLRTYQDLNDP